jgi:hypothetical protein
MVRLLAVRAAIAALKRAIAISDKLKPRMWMYLILAQVALAALFFWGYYQQAHEYRVQPQEKSVAQVHYEYTEESYTQTSTSVPLAATASDPDGDTLLYTWSTTGGRITGDGPNATWDLSGVAPGTYTALVEVDDGCGCIAYTPSTNVIPGNVATNGQNIWILVRTPATGHVALVEPVTPGTWPVNLHTSNSNFLAAYLALAKSRNLTGFDTHGWGASSITSDVHPHHEVRALDFTIKPFMTAGGGSTLHPQIVSAMMSAEDTRISTGAFNAGSLWSALIGDLFNPWLPRFQPNVMMQVSAPEGGSLLGELQKLVVLCQAITLTIGSVFTSIFGWIAYQRGKAEMRLKQLQIRKLELEIEQMEKDAARKEREAANAGIVFVLN